jgi:hypothetical protein
MKSTGIYLFAAGLLAFGIGLMGCSNPSAPSAANPPTNASSSSGNPNNQPAEHEHEGGHEHSADHEANGDSAMGKMAEGLAKLPAEDRESAEKQHTCPVSGEMLGSMGAPIKVTVKDQDVWICCNGCKKKLLDSPDEYLAKLKK